MLLRGWAPGWKITQVPIKVQNRDEYWAAFEDRFAKSVQVHVTARDLKGFGKAAKKREHLEEILRAILECYVNEKGQPPPRIDARDLRTLPALKRVFVQMSDSSGP